MPFFICPNCKNRSVDHDGYEGMTREAVALPPLRLRLPVRADGRLLPGAERRLRRLRRPGARARLRPRRLRADAASRGGADRAATSSRRFQLGGFEADRNPVALALEWGVRRLGEQLELTTRGGQRKHVIVDIFPAYDDDGGLLVALTPDANAPRPRTRRAEIGEHAVLAARAARVADAAAVPDQQVREAMPSRRAARA